MKQRAIQIAARHRRLLAHSVAVFAGWPLLTIIAATIEAGGMPYYHVPVHQALAGSVAGVFLLAPDFAFTGLLLLLSSVFVFNRFGRAASDRAHSALRLCLEPTALLVALFCGTSVWYPTVLSHALLVPFWPLPASVALATVAFVGVMLVQEVGPRGGRLRLTVVLGAVGFAAPIPSMLAGAMTGGGRATDIVVLGLDSLAQTDDVRPLRHWIGSHGGAWYQQAVSPGLVTNAVWASVMTRQPVREHGVFHAFQRLPFRNAPLIQQAKQAGYHTISVFPDQTTCAVGSEAGFDEDRSGPQGWRQLAVATVQNSGVVVPLVRPLLPRMPWSVAPPNQAGTFTYDLRREIREVLTQGRPDRPTFLAAHLTYLHIAAYPRLSDLSLKEILAIAAAPAGSLRDRSFDWDDVDQPTDALQLRRWKIGRLQSVVASEVEGTKFVERGGKLLLFSDHGERSGLTPETFSREKYHHVVLATVGLPARTPDTPTSLIDIASLVGFASTTPPADPVVEFAIGPPELWIKLADTSRVHWSGAVDLDAELLRGIFHHLRAHRPWASSPR